MSSTVNQSMVVNSNSKEMDLLSAFLGTSTDYYTRQLIS